MTAGAACDPSIRYVDEEGEVTLTTAAEVDLRRAARAVPAWRRHGSAHPLGPEAAGSRGWIWGAAHLPHDRHLDLDRLWVAAFDPVERWIVARPIRGLDLAAVRRLVSEPSPIPGELSDPSHATRLSRNVPRAGDLARIADVVLTQPCQLGVSLVGSLLHVTAGGLGAARRRLLNSWAR